MFFPLADAAQAGAPEQGMQQMIVLFGIAIVLFYFILWRPEQKKRKTLDAQRQALKKGDKVVLAGGIIAEVFKIQNESIIVNLVEGKMEVLKGSIQEIQPSEKSENS